MSDSTDFRIIIIDDNPAIHQDFQKILASHNETVDSSALDKLSTTIFGAKKSEEAEDKFEIETASQGKEGVEKIKKALEIGKPYSLAFVDIRMPPGWDGIETIKHIWELDKDIQVVICTAYSDYSWEETIQQLGKNDNLLILKKPFDNVAVRQLACALTKKWQLHQEHKNYTKNLEQEVSERTASLEKSLSLVKATLESSNDGILVINSSGNIVDYNQRLLSMWQIPRSVLHEKTVASWFNFMNSVVDNPDEFFFKINSQFQRGDKNVNIDVIKFKDGSIFECYSQPQFVNESVVGCVLNFRDLTKRVKLEEELQHQATHDALTGLPNRVMLLNRLRQMIKTSVVNQTSFAVISIDLDRFKLINDSLTHAVGDELLQATAKRLQSIIRGEDTLARLGGDEFIVLIGNLANSESIIPKAQKILSCFQEPFKIAERNITVTASIGISIFPEDGTTPDVLLRNSDSAMYRAQEKGANCFQFYTPEISNINLAKLDLEIELRQALKNDQLYIYYQPQFDFRKEKIIAVEALLRWHHPTKGVLLPRDFIPFAEESGLIVAIGEWALHSACAQNKKWQSEGISPIRMAINITAHQLKQHNFVGMIEAILTESTLDPQYLELEFSENVMISSLEVIDIAKSLQKSGIVISITDFGTGYSSLSSLKKLPINKLKIDSSLIHHIQAVGDDEVTIRAIISAAHHLNIEVLAEGVETRTQLDFLRALKCNEIQGVYFSKPLTAEQLKALLTKFT